MKKIFSLLFALSLVLVLLPLSASAEANTDDPASTGCSHSFSSNDICTACSAVKISEVTFPDENFRSFIASQSYGEDGALTKAELSKITTLKPRSQNIKDLTGIEHFTALTSLDCGSNQLTSLDVSKNLALTELVCNLNRLESLDVSKNTALTKLYCFDNSLTKLDVSKNTALQRLALQGNCLKSLDVSKNTSLKMLSCGYNDLVSLDVSKNTALTELLCNSNNLTALDISKNTALNYLDCDDNHLTSLNLSKNTALTYVMCSYNQLETLDVSKNTALTGLSCSYNQLKTLNVSKNTALRYLYCEDNQLVCLDLSKNPKLETETFGNTRLITTVQGKFDLNKLVKDGFDITKASDWSGGTVSGMILTADSKYISYVYDLGNGKTETFNLFVIDNLEPPVVKAGNNASTGKVKLTWEKLDGAVKYEVYRATSKSGEYKLMKTTTGTSYTNTSAKTGTTYYYKVRSVAEDGTKSGWSSIVSRACDLPQPTVKATNVASSGKVKLTWKKLDGAKEYKVYRATSKDGEYKLMKTTTGTSYTNTSADAGTTYYYKVKAIHSKSSANSAYSEVVTRTCDLARPVVTIKLKNGDPRLTWDKVAGATEYQVYRATSKDGEYKLMKTTTGTSYTNTSAKSGKTYYYKVKAIHSNSVANSAYSSVDSIKAK